MSNLIAFNPVNSLTRHADVCRTSERPTEKGLIEGRAPLAYTHEKNCQEYSEYRLDSVKRTIERCAESGAISLPPLEEVKVQRERREEPVTAYNIFFGA